MNKLLKLRVGAILWSAMQAVSEERAVRDVEPGDYDELNRIADEVYQRVKGNRPTGGPVSIRDQMLLIEATLRRAVELVDAARAFECEEREI